LFSWQFRGKQRTRHVLVLDEIDQLGKDVLYRIFEWPNFPQSNLILIGIANGLDLTGRVVCECFYLCI
jgi:cell division control protein 6